MRRGAAGALALAVALASGGPAKAAERWIAVSSTAMAVTGDVQFTPARLGFQSGAFLELEPGRAVRDFPVDGERVSGVLSAVKQPADPVLLRGNRLCGRGAVTWVLVWRASAGEPGHEGRGLAVFDGAGTPGSGGGACATYRYEAAG